MKITYLGDQERTYPRFISVGEDCPPKTLEAVPGGTYDVVASSGHPVPVPTDGLWEGADDDAKAALQEALNPPPPPVVDDKPAADIPPPTPATGKAPSLSLDQPQGA